MAGDPASVILLLAMRFDSLSMSPLSLARVKWVIREFTLAKAQQILADVLLMESPVLIREYLERELKFAGLEALVPVVRN